jgi:hypothetical protein
MVIDVFVDVYTYIIVLIHTYIHTYIHVCMYECMLHSCRVKLEKIFHKSNFIIYLYFDFTTGTGTGRTHTGTHTYFTLEKKGSYNYSDEGLYNTTLQYSI